MWRVYLLSLCGFSHNLLARMILQCHTDSKRNRIFLDCWTRVLPVMIEVSASKTRLKKQHSAFGCRIGVVNSKKLSSSELFSTDFGPKVTDQPRIFPAASIWSCTVASNLKNATSLPCSKFNPNEISF